MQTDSDIASRLIAHLIAQGYPKDSIAVEYQIGKNRRIDLVVLDIMKNIPIQIFEIKSAKNSETIQRGKEQLKEFLSFLKNKNTPAYLVFPNENEPNFEIVDIKTLDIDQKQEFSENLAFAFNYNAQRNARIAEEANLIKKEKEHEVDRFKITCWIIAGVILVGGILAKLLEYKLEATDLTIIGAAIVLILVPYGSKIKILGIEFERLIGDDRKKKTEETSK